MANDRASPLPLPPSLWAATARPAPATPRLAESCRADVAIVGAGYSGLAAALRMREAVRHVSAAPDDLTVKIGLHEGPCLAVMMNDRLDYFGQTVNIAARVQGLAHERAIFATKPVVEHPQVARMLATGNLVATEQLAALRGVADKMAVFQIP